MRRTDKKHDTRGAFTSRAAAQPPLYTGAVNPLYFAKMQSWARMSTQYPDFEHGLSTVLISCSKVAFCQSTMSTEAKMRAQNEHRAARSRCCYFAVNLLTKGAKKCIMYFAERQLNLFYKIEYRHIQEHGFALRRKVQRNGVKIPDAETAL